MQAGVPDPLRTGPCRACGRPTAGIAMDFTAQRELGRSVTYWVCEGCTYDLRAAMRCEREARAASNARLF